MWLIGVRYHSLLNVGRPMTGVTSVSTKGLLRDMEEQPKMDFEVEVFRGRPWQWSPT